VVNISDFTRLVLLVKHVNPQAMKLLSSRSIKEQPTPHRYSPHVNIACYAKDRMSIGTVAVVSIHASPVGQFETSCIHAEIQIRKSFLFSRNIPEDLAKE